MAPAAGTLFQQEVWTPALEKFAAVTHFTVQIYDVDGHIVCGPINPTPLFALFAERGYDPGIFNDCAHRCLAQSSEQPAAMTASAYGLAAIGTSLFLDGKIIGAAVAGYALLEFSQSPFIERLARQAGVPFRHVWELTRRQQPLPERRLLLHGQLLQVLGDTILRENARTRQYEETATELAASVLAKDEFLAVLSHELRTPLTPILNWAHMLKRAADPALIEQAAEVIERNVRLQARLIDDLLELTRVRQGKLTLDLKVQELSDAIHMAIGSIIEPAKAKDIAVEIREADKPLFIEADAGRLQQILANVLSNALKFTPSGGRIAVVLTAEKDAAVVTIHDTGEGIAPAFLPFVFDMFRQQEEGTRRKHPGLGVGLALVKGLTELQGGTVAIVSHGVGLGTEVMMRFPIVAKTSETHPESSLETAAFAIHGVRVLIVDDMDDVRESTRLVLEQLGADVRVAVDGRDALDVVARSPQDVVLCDLRMPHMDGFEFIRELRTSAAHANLPVIAMSGLTSTADHLRTKAAGFEGHINKPFDHNVLLAALESAIGRQHA